MGPFQDEFGAGSSPVIIDGKIIVKQDHDTDSFLATINPRDGTIIWKTDRPTAVRSYSTPVAFEFEGRKQLATTR
ncbi:MAG: hypothetical protein M2R45_01707 [Verrucomicrobia subdivision 3 bacterium]|nr:hypothetical protein [Limisphaerales bacterium]MCS1413446.1 hypothetical protein [Limisphaerales bacterium]